MANPEREPSAAVEKPERFRTHLPALDGVRGVAALMVFLYHYAGGTHSSVRAMQIFGYVNRGGWSGVVLFFVLSGFLITGILWDGFSDTGWWRKFFARRSLRIFPLYYLAMIVVLAGAAVAGTFHKALQVIWIPSLFLEDMPFLAGRTVTLPSPFPCSHIWSIAVEEQFYLLWPALLFWCWRGAAGQDRRAFTRNVCLAVFLGSLIFRLVVWRFNADPLQYEHFLLTQGGALAAGGWLALAYRGPEWKHVVRFAPLAAVAGLLGFGWIGFSAATFGANSPEMMTLGLFWATLLFAGILTLAVDPGWLAHLFANPALRWVGNLSYGIYVFHVLLLPLFEALTHELADGRSLMVVNLVRAVLAAVLSAAIAWISYNLFEKQFLRLKKYFLVSPRQPLAAQSVSVPFAPGSQVSDT